MRRLQYPKFLVLVVAMCGLAVMVIAPKAAAVYDGTYTVVSLLSAHRCLDITGASTADGARLQTWDCIAGATQQQFWVDLQPNGFERLINVHSGKCLDVKDGSAASGAALQQWTCHSPYPANQLFSFNNHSTTWTPFYTETALPNKCLSVPDSATNGQKVTQQACGGAFPLNMQWRFYPVP